MTSPFPTRTVVLEDGQSFQVPRGIARNTRNRAWQLKQDRNGQRLASGNFPDQTHGGAGQALEAAIKAMVPPSEAPLAQLPTLQLSENVILRWLVQPPKKAVIATIYDKDARKARQLHLCTARQLNKDFDAALNKALSILIDNEVINANLEGLDFPALEGLARAGLEDN